MSTGPLVTPGQYRTTGTIRQRYRQLCEEPVQEEDDEYIGFASLPEQVHRKAMRKGFDFTLMVVGETGLGKSTLINSLFLMDLYKDRKVDNIEERIHKTVEMEKKELEIEERGVKLKLTIVDTPGFNDSINAEDSWQPVLDYVDGQFDAYYKAESGLNRKNIQDTRVHCCLYFISPYGHGLKQADVMVMRKLHHKVNLIPLIAKSDMLTRQECRRLKDRILEEIQRHRIDVYQFPECDSDEDEEFKQQDQELKSCLPFAVVGSNTVVEAGGKKVRGRMYPWGIVEVENPLHSDFTKLRRMLISTHMQDLKDMTCEVHYENYRAERLSGAQVTSHADRGKLKRDSAAPMEADLVTDRLLREKEEEIRRMAEVVAKMQAQLQSQNSPRVYGSVAQV
ncbi:septin-5-like isoform X2 [Dreissena polymorpha]|uniref:septin-5-like isoform X2 n=1 Tax=Dreissena polymorpha TaxID=45954 RepID=UPI002264596F|nr:septin-5-like isoform X2 [Dreissena polymorpha]